MIKFGSICTGVTSTSKPAESKNLTTKAFVGLNPAVGLMLIFRKEKGGALLVSREAIWISVWQTKFTSLGVEILPLVSAALVLMVFVFGYNISFADFQFVVPSAICHNPPLSR